MIQPAKESWSVDDILGRDHEELGRRLDELRDLIEAASAGTMAAFERFVDKLNYHITWEEQVLFPALRPRLTPGGRRSLESLEIDHERIRDAVGALGAVLEERNFFQAEGAASWLDILIEGHNGDEEYGAYVDADHLLDDAERRALLARFRPESA